MVLQSSKRFAKGIDWILFFSALLLVAAGMVTMHSFVDPSETLLGRQIIFTAVGLLIFFGISFFDTRFLKQTNVLLTLFGIGLALLLGLFLFGSTVKGATSWYNLGFFSFQPSDPMKIVLILILAKYLSRRHVEIARLKHILITGLYFFIPFALILLQPDFGSAIIFFCIWFGMVLVSGISKKHLFGLLALLIIAFAGMWTFVFKPYQKARIISFIQPLQDIQGAGYNAYQSTVAVGSGRIMGKGVGYGTQSRLQFLPEHETDFIFASFAEEWGFIGASLILILFGIVVWRILRMSMHGGSNFEILFGVGVSLYLISHVLINVGMNIGLLPVTGITLPFMSAGGSHLLTEFLALGIIMSMRNHMTKHHHKDDTHHEFLGIS